MQAIWADERHDKLEPCAIPVTRLALLAHSLSPSTACGGTNAVYRSSGCLRSASVRKPAQRHTDGDFTHLDSASARSDVMQPQGYSRFSNRAHRGKQDEFVSGFAAFHHRLVIDHYRPGSRWSAESAFPVRASPD
jgi:hypothetical protein